MLFVMREIPLFEILGGVTGQSHEFRYLTPG
jgi:hypothetical protein